MTQTFDGGIADSGHDLKFYKLYEFLKQEKNSDYKTYFFLNEITRILFYIRLIHEHFWTLEFSKSPEPEFFGHSEYFDYHYNNFLNLIYMYKVKINLLADRIMGEAEKKEVFSEEVKIFKEENDISRAIRSRNDYVHEISLTLVEIQNIENQGEEVFRRWCDDKKDNLKKMSQELHELNKSVFVKFLKFFYSRPEEIQKVTNFMITNDPWIQQDVRYLSEADFEKISKEIASEIKRNLLTDKEGLKKHISDIYHSGVCPTFEKRLEMVCDYHTRLGVKGEILFQEPERFLSSDDLASFRIWEKEEAYPGAKSRIFGWIYYLIFDEHMKNDSES